MVNDENNNSQPLDDRYLRNWTYFGILLGAFVLAAQTDQLNIPDSPTAKAAYVFGAGLAYAAIPLGIAAFINRIAGIASLVALGGIVIYGSPQDERQVDGPFTYRQKDCEFSAVFPSKPIIETVSAAGVGEYQHAIWYNPDQSTAAFLKVECVPSSVGGLSNEEAKDYILSSLSSFATQQELTYTHYDYQSDGSVRTAKLQGQKAVHGIKTTYYYFSTFFYCGLYPGKTMNDPPKQRKDDPKEAPHFRTHRIHAINSDWYF